MDRSTPLFLLPLVAEFLTFVFPPVLITQQAGCKKSLYFSEGSAIAQICGFPPCPLTLVDFLIPVLFFLMFIYF